MRERGREKKKKKRFFKYKANEIENFIAVYKHTIHIWSNDYVDDNDYDLSKRKKKGKERDRERERGKGNVTIFLIHMFVLNFI